MSTRFRRICVVCRGARRDSNQASSFARRDACGTPDARKHASAAPSINRVISSTRHPISSSTPKYDRVDRNDDPSALQKAIIPANEARKVIADLDSMGINHDSVFSDLDGIARATFFQILYNNPSQT